MRISSSKDAMAAEVLERRQHHNDRDKFMGHYLQKLKDKPYQYGKIVFPHDQAT